MLNALSRAAIGALKAGKTNLTPKIVQNELPKAMVATSSNCEYDVVSRAAFSLILLAGSRGRNSADLSIFRLTVGKIPSVLRYYYWVDSTEAVSVIDVYLGPSFAVMAPPAAAAAFNVLGLYLSSIVDSAVLWIGVVEGKLFR